MVLATAFASRELAVCVVACVAVRVAVCVAACVSACVAVCVTCGPHDLQTLSQERKIKTTLAQPGCAGLHCDEDLLITLLFHVFCWNCPSFTTALASHGGGGARLLSLC